MEKNDYKNALVSVVIPCRNEEGFTAYCLDSLVLQDYPKESLEILVVVGESNDRTKEIVQSYSKRYSYIKLLENQKKITPIGLNIGIKAAQGSFIVLMSAHAKYQRDYISKCIKYLENYKEADAVGGSIKSIPAQNSLLAKTISLVMSHPFGTGNSYFRTGSKVFRWVDTAFGGCYRKEVFNKIGPYNENLVKSQDMEFNLRLKKVGGKILLAPDIVNYYYPESNFKGFLCQNFIDGIWAIYILKFVKTKLRLRHYIPFIFVSSLFLAGILAFFSPFFFWLFLTIIISYLIVNFYFSIKIAKKENDIQYFFLMPLIFATRHIGYGLGSIFGFIKLLLCPVD